MKDTLKFIGISIVMIFPLQISGAIAATDGITWTGVVAVIVGGFGIQLFANFGYEKGKKNE